MLIRIAKEGNNLLLLARIEGACVDFASGFLDFLDQRLKLGAVAANTVKPSEANFLAISPPMKSPAPITATVAFLFCKGVLPG
jgi:hypothetical protein